MISQGREDAGVMKPGSGFIRCINYFDSLLRRRRRHRVTYGPGQALTKGVGEVPIAGETDRSRTCPPRSVVYPVHVRHLPHPEVPNDLPATPAYLRHGYHGESVPGIARDDFGKVISGGGTQILVAPRQLRVDSSDLPRRLLERDRPAVDALNRKEMNEGSTAPGGNNWRLVQENRLTGAQLRVYIDSMLSERVHEVPPAVPRGAHGGAHGVAMQTVAILAEATASAAASADARSPVVPVPSPRGSTEQKSVPPSGDAPPAAASRS